MQLLIDEAFEMDSEIIEEINEASGSKQKNYYIQGTFSTPDKKNRNGRVYSSKLWEDNVQKYQTHIKENTKNTLGELEHPTRVDVDPMKAVMKIVSLKMDEGVVKGRAKILNDNSPETNKLKALIDEGMKIGVSSRGTGRMKGSIVEEFQLSTYDIVQSPSDYNAMLSGISESTEAHVSLNESTGQYICDDKGCSLQESKPRSAYSEKELKGGIKELKDLLKKHGDKKDIAGVLNMQIERLETFLQMGKKFGFGISETIDKMPPPSPSPCSLKAEALIKTLDEYVNPSVISNTEKLAMSLMGNEIDEAADLKKLEKLISSVEKEIKKMLEAGAGYAVVRKLEQELKDIKAYAKNTGITEGKFDRLADKVLAALPDTKSQFEFERKNGSVYKMDKDELEKYLKQLTEADSVLEYGDAEFILGLTKDLVKANSKGNRREVKQLLEELADIIDGSLEQV